MTTADVTFASIMDAMRKAEAIQRPNFDCVVCLPTHWEALKKTIPDHGDLSPCHLCGLPVYVMADPATAIEEAIRLKKAGKRPLLVTDNALLLPMSFAPPPLPKWFWEKP